MHIKTLSLLAVLAALTGPALMAGALTGIRFSSGANINDTIPGDVTAPLAFTNTTDLLQPFLNNADSSISLGFGSYYAITYIGGSGHVGAGVISFSVNGTPFSQNVVFPGITPGGVTFANFALPGGESVVISTTGLSADRIVGAANGAGLFPGGGPDNFYRFTYSDAASSTPEPGTLCLAAFGVAVFGLKRRLQARR